MSTGAPADCTAHAGYAPVRASGEKSRHLVGFARRHGTETVVTVAPRLFAGLGVRARDLPCGGGVWADARIELAFLEDGTVLRDAFTLREHRVENQGIDVGALLQHFPVAVLSL